MSAPILYLGDTSRQTAAGYLLGLLDHWQWPCDYLASDQQVTLSDAVSSRSLFIVSDYPAANMGQAEQSAIARQVETGAGLIMIGGWESFHGLGGNWDQTELARLLPVSMSTVDDRQNCGHPVVIRQCRRHPLVDGLPWSEAPTLIGGLNRTVAKPDTETLLEAVHCKICWQAGRLDITSHQVDPLLVVGEAGSGRVAAFMSDVAPHWVGPLIDWGPDRVRACAPGADEVEVGSWYAQFFRQLLQWTGQLPAPR